MEKIFLNTTDYKGYECEARDFFYEEGISFTDEDVYNRAQALIWDDFDIELAQLSDFFKDTETIFVGSFGRWDGTFEGGKIGSFKELFDKAFVDCSEFCFFEDKGHLYLKGMHHDGTVCVEVKILTDKGKDFFENWNYGFDDKYNFSEQELHKRIMKSNLLSKLPHYGKKIFGWTEK